MTVLEKLTEIFSVDNKPIYVVVNGTDYMFYKDNYEAWIDGAPKVPLFLADPSKREKFGYRWVKTENIKIKQKD